MISNRRGARRSASPVERLREFAINTSKGIDVTQAPVNNDTVVHAKNLIVNPDGSLSLRKPLKQISSSAFPTHTLFDGSVLTSTGAKDETKCFRDGEAVYVNVEWYSYRGTKHEWFANDGIVDFFEDSSKISVLNLNTSSIICNANLSISFFDTTDENGLEPDETGWLSTNIVNKALYDDVEYVPRYVKITKGTRDDEDIFIFTVLNPESNELRFGTDGELALDPNMVLDNPYAIKDSYGTVSPISKGIVAYACATHAEIPTLKEISISSEILTPTQYSPELHTKASVKLPTGIAPRHYTATSVVVLSEGSVLNLDFTIDIYKSNEITYYLKDLAIAAKLETSYKEGTFTIAAEASEITIKIYTMPADSEILADTIVCDVEKSDIDLAEAREVSTSATLNRTISIADEEIFLEVLVPYSFTETRAFVTALDISDLPINTVDDLTASVKTTRFTPILSVGSSHLVILKAFGKFPVQVSDVFPTYWGTWYASYDGVSWTPVRFASYADLTVVVKTSDPETTPNAVYFPFYGESGYEPLQNNGYMFVNRPDILPILPERGKSPLRYKFRVVTLGDSEDLKLDPDYDPVKIYKEESLVSEVFYDMLFDDRTEFVYTEFDNAVYGNKLYHKKRIYSYGHEKFFNNIFVSDIDNFETPLYNIIDIDAKQSDNVSVVIPWRDYLMSATSNSIYLHTPQDNGFLTKTVTTSLGIPKEDSQCCVSVLNGVVTKSGSKIYLVYPNVYSGTDDVLNVAPISQPVDEYLQVFEDASDRNPFAFSTESEYILMLPFDEKTMCLRYNYTTRIWCMCEYPVRLYDYRINNVEDIRLYGILENGEYAEFKFDAEVKVDADTDNDGYPDGDVYVDVIGTQKVPIQFEWDSGQKTDNIATRKQFVESKIAFTTEDAIEDFPMELIVAVDGDPNLIRIDVRTDAPLIKTEGSVGVLGTQIRASEGDTSLGVSNRGLVRHLIVRYSGRGRSVRHVLTGTAKSPFRLYEAYVRYKLLDNKR